MTSYPKKVSSKFIAPTFLVLYALLQAPSHDFPYLLYLLRKIPPAAFSSVFHQNCCTQTIPPAFQSDCLSAPLSLSRHLLLRCSKSITSYSIKAFTDVPDHEQISIWSFHLCYTFYIDKKICFSGIWNESPAFWERKAKTFSEKYLKSSKVFHFLSDIIFFYKLLFHNALRSHNIFIVFYINSIFYYSF